MNFDGRKILKLLICQVIIAKTFKQKNYGEMNKTTKI